MSAQPWRIIIRRHGGPEVLEREDWPLMPPSPNHILVRIAASGVNYIDSYHRAGLYPLQLPSGIGTEMAGVVEAIGEGVDAISVGDRITAILRSPGSYATHVEIEAATAIKLPDRLSEEQAAAALLKGLTAWMLIEQCGKIAPGHVVLVHAAAGGVGSILVPWAKKAGATVIAHAGSREKAEKARQRGADYSFSGSMNALPEQVRAATDGHGADVILDGVGAASWAASLASVARRGTIASFGNASGPVPPISPLELLSAGSIFLTRPSLFDYTDTSERLNKGAERLFALIADGTLNIEIGQRFALADAANAHRTLEARQTTGSTILIP